MKRILTIIIIVGIAVVGFVAFRNYSTQQNTIAMMEELNTEETSRGTLVATVGVTGVVRASQTATLLWSASGIVEEVDTSVGDIVEINKVLARLSQTSLSQNVILAESELVAAKQSLEALFDAHSELAIARAAQAVAEAQKEIDTSERWVNNLTSPARQTDVDEAESNMILAKDKLDKALEDFAPYEHKPVNDVIRATLLSKLAQAQNEYDLMVLRYNSLLGEVNSLELQSADADLALALARLVDAQDEYDRLLTGPDPDDIASAEARIAAAEATLKMAYIEAPFSGTITEVLTKIGDRVSPNQSAFRLDDLSRLYLDIDISEVDINRITSGQEVLLTFDAIVEKEFHGEVVEVSLVGTTSQGVVNFKVTVELIDPDEAVKPGMTAAVNIIVSHQENVLLVPNRAVRIVDGQRVVYILQEGGSTSPENQRPENGMGFMMPGGNFGLNNMQLIEITLGATDGIYSEVLNGDLNIGDLIILNPPSTLFEEQRGPFGGMGG
jgi:HlyD family secretion protein